MTTNPKTRRSTRKSASPQPGRYGERVLYLNGLFELPGVQKYRFRATLRIDPATGESRGHMFWQKLQLNGAPTRRFATENVLGRIQASAVNLEGVAVDHPSIVPDDYEIQLVSGTESGRFEGRTRAFGSWRGCVSGTYQFVNR